MPELTRVPGHQQYPQQFQPSLAPTMAYYQAARPVSSYYADLATTGAQASLNMVAYDSYGVGGVPQLQIPTANTGLGGPVGSLPTQHRASSGAWTQEDDRTLIGLRAMGKNWNAIQREAFPTKTGNACRKRHERLMERRGQNDFDNRKLERLSKEYMSMRKEIWQPLAARCGEKWNVVEAQCMSNGLKNIQSHARAYSRRERLESGQPLGAYDDDSGISGIGLTPIDDDDVADHSYSSPEPSGSTGAHSTPGASSGGSSTASHQTYGAAAMHQQGSYQGYNAYHHHQPHHGYSHSVSSTGTAAAYAGQGQPGSQGASPYMGHGNRLPSVGDMGIDAIINRGPGSQGNGV